MVIESNNQIAFANLQSKSFPQAENEPCRSQRGECFRAICLEHKLSSTERRRQTKAVRAASILRIYLSLNWPGRRCWPEWFPHSPSAGCTCSDRGSSSRGRQRSRSCTDPTSDTSSPSQSQDLELLKKERVWKDLPSLKFSLKKDGQLLHTK